MCVGPSDGNEIRCDCWEPEEPDDESHGLGEPLEWVLECVRDGVLEVLLGWDVAVERWCLWPDEDDGCDERDGLVVDVGPGPADVDKGEPADAFRG
jgi:hypothetical protein